MRIMTILIGVPGSGKSRLARALQNEHFEQSNCLICSADDYFMEYSEITKRYEYNWDASKLNLAHEECLRKAELACVSDIEQIIIDNNNLKMQHMRPYIELAGHYGYAVQRIIMYDNPFESLHCSDENALNKMRYRLGLILNHLGNKITSSINIVYTN